MDRFSPSYHKERERGGGACHKEDGGRKISFGISLPSRVITGVYYRGTKEEEKSPSFFVPLNEQLTSRERERKGEGERRSITFIVTPRSHEHASMRESKKKRDEVLGGV